MGSNPSPSECLIINELRRNSCIGNNKGNNTSAGVCAPLKQYILSLPAPGEDPHTALHPRACETIRKQGYASNVSRWFGELLAQAGFRTVSDHRGREIGRKRQELSFHGFPSPKQ